MAIFGPKFTDVWRSSSERPGTTVGIRVREKNEDESTYRIEEYAVNVGGSEYARIFSP
jgi:hypothetical protein